MNYYTVYYLLQLNIYRESVAIIRTVQYQPLNVPLKSSEMLSLQKEENFDRACESK